jgi:hypothetical protein
MVQLEVYALSIGCGVVLPIFLARIVANARWAVIALASVAWLAFIYFWIVNGWRYEREAALWAMGFAMFSNWLAVPVISLFLSAGLRIFRRRNVR